MNYRLSTKKVLTVFKVCSTAFKLKAIDTNCRSLAYLVKAHLIWAVAFEINFKFSCIQQYFKNRTDIWIYALTFIIWVHLYAHVTVNVKPTKRYHPNKFKQTQVPQIRGW